MWNDIETTTDYLHFSVVSETIADLIVESGENPISVGVSGSWGSGKSSMVKMVGKALKEKNDCDRDSSYIFVEFNAWLYQGYDDAKSALLQVISQKLEEEADKRKPISGGNIKEKISSFIKRVNWFQVSKLALPLFAGFIPGLSAFGPFMALANSFGAANKNKENIEANTETVESAYNALTPELKELLKTNESESTTQQIDKLRQEFEDLLKELNVTLVVLVDDLDRCLPETAVSTLEAMRLLLFVKRTAFIIAADEQMIRNGVKAHFGNVDLSDGLVTSYFDKLIQVPITVPHLGIPEIKIYITLLFLELEVRRKTLDVSVLENAISRMQLLLSNVWSEEITIESLSACFDEETLKIMRESIVIADQLAGILVTSDSIKGNPRLIKRFLNALEIRKKIAKINGMTLDFKLLMKMLLFERCASSAAFEFLAKEINNAVEGKPEFIQEIESKVEIGDSYECPDTSWNTDFIKDWLKLSPRLSGVDMRPILYLSKDRSMPIAVYDELSPDAKESFDALKAVKSGVKSNEIIAKLKLLGTTDLNLIFNYMVAIGRNKQWDNDSIYAMLHLTEVSVNLGNNFAAILAEIPAISVKPAMIPLIADKKWAKELLDNWYRMAEIPQPVKRAIEQQRGGK